MKFEPHTFNYLHKLLSYTVQEIPQQLIREGYSKTEFLLDGKNAPGEVGEPEILGSVTGRSEQGDDILPKFHFSNSFTCKLISNSCAIAI